MTDLFHSTAAGGPGIQPNEIPDDCALCCRATAASPPEAVCALGEEQHPNTEQMDARGQLVMPGTFAPIPTFTARSPAAYIPALHPRTSPTSWGAVGWRLDRALLDVDVEYSASSRFAGRHQARHDDAHRPSRQPQRHRQLADQIADAVEQAGVRAALCTRW